MCHHKKNKINNKLIKYRALLFIFSIMKSKKLLFLLSIETLNKYFFNFKYRCISFFSSNTAIRIN